MPKQSALFQRRQSITDDSMIQICGGMMHQYPREAAESSIVTINASKNIIDIALKASDDVGRFEMDIINEVSTTYSSLIGFRYKLIRWQIHILSFILSCLIVVLFGMLSVWETLFSEAVISYGLNPVEKYWVLAISFGLLAIFITTVPSIFSFDDGKISKHSLRLYTKNNRVLSRIKRLLTWISKNEDKTKTIRIWNTGAFSNKSWVWESLMPAVVTSNVQLEVIVFNDEVDNVTHALQQIDKTLSFTLTSLDLQEASSDLTQNIKTVMREDERHLYDVMRLFSAAGPANENPLFKKLVSVDLAEYTWNQYVIQNHTDYHVNSFVTLTKRLTSDYRLMFRAAEYWHLNYSNLSSCNKELNVHFVHLHNVLLGGIDEIANKIQDPVAYLILLTAYTNEFNSIKHKADLFSQLVIRIKELEQYALFHAYWPDIQNIFPSCGETLSLEQGQVGVYRYFDTSTLSTLSILFERAALFDEAIFISKYLSIINPLKYITRTARMLERKGQYQNAMTALDNIDQELIKCEPDTDHCLSATIDYHLIYSWTVVSAPFTHLREQGKDHLDSAKRLLLGNVGKHQEPNQLWHYYNNLANYCEWDDDFGHCIENHYMCLCIPGLELKWVSGTHVNLGIAYRESAIRCAEQCADLLEKSIQHGQQGISVKQALGDFDELPIALHNQALNLLTRNKMLNSQKENDFTEVINLVANAIHILYESKSTKKLGLLFCERFIAEQQLSSLKNDSAVTEEHKVALSDLQQWLDDSANIDTDECSTLIAYLVYFDVRKCIPIE